MARARVEGITKPVNLAQLAAELGTDQVFGDDYTPDEQPRTILAETTQPALEAAVAVHVADELYGQPQENRDMSVIRTKAQAVFNETDTFTAAQIQKLVAALVLRATRKEA